MRGPNRVARVRDAFCFWFLVFGARRGRRRLVLFGVTFDRNALRDDGKHEPEPLHRPRALHRELLARVLQSERLKPHLVRQRGLNHPHPVCSRRPLRGRQRRGSSGQRLARSRQAVALVADGALDSRVLGARASQVLGGVPRALRRERGPGSLRAVAPPRRGHGPLEPRARRRVRATRLVELRAAIAEGAADARRAHDRPLGHLRRSGGRVEGERAGPGRWNGRTGVLRNVIRGRGRSKARSSPDSWDTRIARARRTYRRGVETPALAGGGPEAPPIDVASPPEARLRFECSKVPFPGKSQIREFDPAS